MTKKKIIIPVRNGKPKSCISCGEELHKKSEYYCSIKCFEKYQDPNQNEKPEFKSKWKIRKRKEIQDPLVKARNKIRKRTRKLIKSGKIQKKNCQYCGYKENVIPHHEDYSNPYDVIWLCEKHHKEYHDGKIALFKKKLKWDPRRLTKVSGKHEYPTRKYQHLLNNGNSL